MKTPAIIASITVVGSIAYAAGSQGTAGKQSPAMPSGTHTHSMQEEMPQARMQVKGGCTGADKYWFTKVHSVTDACSAFTDSAVRQDINGDGVGEYLRIGSDYILRNGQDPLICCVYINEAASNSGEPTFTNSCVLKSTVFVEFVKSNFPQATWGIAWFVGFRDMDGDEDLDLIANLSLADDDPNPANGGNPTWAAYQEIWLENTGFQRTKRVAADLNGDGIVDGNDLGNLLAAWGVDQ
jgi:hypothetical protein